MNCIPLSLGLSGANARVPEGRDPRSSPHQTPEGGSSVSFLVFFCSDEPEGVGAWHSSRPWSPHMALSGSLGRAGPWRLALAPQRPDFWARPRLPATKHAHTCSMPPGPRPGRHVPLSGVCLAGGGAGQRSRGPCLWFGGNEEPEVPHLRLCLSSSESASWGAAPLLLGMKWRRRPAEAAVRWVFVGGRVQRATRASPLRLSLLASAPFL